MVGDGETRALTRQVARWLVSVLADSGVRLPGKEARLREIVHGTVARAIGPALAYRQGKLGRDLLACFAAPPGRELPPEAVAEDLHRAIAARIEDMVRGESFYASYYRDELLTRLLHDALVQALREFLANGPGVDAEQAARLNAFGLDVDSADLVVRNEAGGGVGGNLVQVGVVTGDVRIGGEDEEPDTPVFVRVEVKATCHLHSEDPPAAFVASGSGVITLLVEARGARAVTLRSLRAVVLSRRPPQPATFVTTAVGIMTPRRFEVDLDTDLPQLVPATGQSRLRRLLRRPGGAGFPYTVSPLDPEMFVIEPRTARYQVEWRLELDWTYRGRPRRDHPDRRRWGTLPGHGVAPVTGPIVTVSNRAPFVPSAPTAVLLRPVLDRRHHGGNTWTPLAVVVGSRWRRGRAWSPERAHHGNPVAEWCFDAVEVRHPPGKPDLIRPDKPERGKTGKRIDAVPTAAMAVGGWKLRGSKPKKSGRMVVMG